MYSSGGSVPSECHACERDSSPCAKPPGRSETATSLSVHAGARAPRTVMRACLALTMTVADRSSGGWDGSPPSASSTTARHGTACSCRWCGKRRGGGTQGSEGLSGGGGGHSLTWGYEHRGQMAFLTEMWSCVPSCPLAPALHRLPCCHASTSSFPYLSSLPLSLASLSTSLVSLSALPVPC